MCFTYSSAFANTYFSNESSKFSFTYNTKTEVLNAQVGLTAPTYFAIATPGGIPNVGVKLIGDTRHNTMTVYSYHRNGQPGKYLGSIQGSIFKDGCNGCGSGAWPNLGHTSINNLDLTPFNDKIAKMGGTKFSIGEKAGLWFGSVEGSIAYQNTACGQGRFVENCGQITNYKQLKFKKRLDYSNRETTPVSEPSSLSILISLLTISAAFAIRKK